METLLEIDYQIFEWINHDWHNSFLDAIMPHWRDKKTWIPLYLLAIAVLIWKYRTKSLVFFVALGLCVGFADQMSSQVIKKSVERLRPCRTPDLEPEAIALVHCGGGYSFPSSHATNHFAIAVFLLLTWGRRWKKYKYLLLFWAGSIALGQVYVGVHFPVDITFGAILGSVIGYAFAKGYEKLINYRIDKFYT